MGCSFFQDPLVRNVLNTLETKAGPIIQTCLVKKGELEAAKALKISYRHTELKELFDKKEEISESKLKELNKEEYHCDRDLILNDADKTQKLFNVGIDVADVLRRGLIDKFTNQLKSAPSLAQAAIKAKIDELTRFTPSQFLHSAFGKPLKKALSKYGVDADALKKYCTQLFEESSKRREAERKEFNIKQNEFPDDISQKTYLDLVEKVCKQISGEDDK